MAAGVAAGVVVLHVRRCDRSGNDRVGNAGDESPLDDIIGPAIPVFQAFATVVDLLK